MTRNVPASIILALAFCGAQPASAADKSSCAPPSWAPNPLPGYAIAKCVERAWDTFDVTVGRDDRTVSGHRVSVTYELKDESKNATAEAARVYYARQGEKAGAIATYDEGYNAYLRKAGPSGDSWYAYEHGSGNEKSTGSYTVTTIEPAPVPQEVQARAMPGPLEVGDASCTDPAWLMKQFAAYKRKDCDSREWDRDELSLTGGKKTIGGRRTVVRYELGDEKAVIVADAGHRNFVDALQKSGAKVVRGEKEPHGEVIATQQTKDGEFWYVWEQAGGNAEHLSGYKVTTWQVVPFPQEVVAKPVTAALDTSGCKDPEWLVKQFPQYKRGPCRNRDFDTVEIETPEGKKTLAGHVHQVVYQLADPHRDETAYVVERNYANALTRIGAQQVSKPKDRNEAVLTQKTADGELWYIYKHSSGNDESTTSYSLITVQAGGPAPRSCKLEIYGVNFDFDKATLKPDSEPVLDQVLAIFKADPKYSGEIGGHTDNVGQKGYNVKLSGERAASVKAWLVAHGVAGARVRTAGYGDTHPLVPNTNDENRAKNRRVELKRDHCTGAGA